MASNERSVRNFVSPEYNGIRVRLNFEDGIDHENAWFYIDFTKVNCIRRLRKKVCDRFGLTRQNINLYLDEYLLSPDETINILQENDCISVRLKVKEAVEEDEDEKKETIVEPAEKSKSNRKRKNEVAETNNKAIGTSFTGELMKKRRRCRAASTKKDVNVGKKGGKTFTFGKLIGVKTPSRKHIRFDDGGDDNDGDGDETMPDEGENEDEIKESDIVDAKQENADDEIRKCYDDFPPLQGPPRIGDILAFKELVLSELYTPEVSEFQEGKVTAVNANSVTLFIKNRATTPQRSNGKFELNWDEMDGVEEPQTQFSAELTLPINSLLQPRLVTIDN